MKLPDGQPEAIRSPLVAELRAARGLLACSMQRGAVRQLPPLAAGLTVPSLWIAGSRDTVMEPRYVRHLAGYTSGHRFELLEGEGHLPMRSAPQALAQLIGSWLVILGLLTPLGALALTSTMATAAYQHILTAGLNIYVLELVVLYLGGSLALLLNGPGRFSFDAGMLSTWNSLETAAADSEAALSGPAPALVSVKAYNGIDPA